MSALTLVTIALITYASRAAAVVLLPRPSERFETVLSRIPVAIFASLATATLLGAVMVVAMVSALLRSLGAVARASAYRT